MCTTFIDNVVMARNSDSNSCLEIIVGGSPTQKVSSGPDRWGRRTQRQGWWTPWQGRRCSRSRDSVDHSSRSFKRSFKTRTSRARSLDSSEDGFADSEVAGTDNVAEVVVEDSVVDGEMVDVDDEQSGSPETICLIITNSFKTRTFWFWLFRTFWLRSNRGEVVVDDSVVGGEMVDDERSGSPETICLIITNNLNANFLVLGSNVSLDPNVLVAFWFGPRRGSSRHNVNAVVVVDDDQSGLPETTSILGKQLLYSKEI